MREATLARDYCSDGTFFLPLLSEWGLERACRHNHKNALIYIRFLTGCHPLRTIGGQSITTLATTDNELYCCVRPEVANCRYRLLNKIHISKHEWCIMMMMLVQQLMESFQSVLLTSFVLLSWRLTIFCRRFPFVVEKEKDSLDDLARKRERV